MAARNYTDSVGSGGASGWYLTRKSSKLIVKKTAWEAPNVLRIVPKPMNATTAEPYRHSGDPYAYTDWIRAYKVAWFVGMTRRLVYIDELPNMDSDLHPTPLQILIGALKTRPEGFSVRWDDYPKDNNALNAIHPSKQTAFVQAVVLVHGKTNYLESGGPLTGVLFCMPKSAKEALEDILEEPNPSFKGDPTDYINRFKHGNLIDPAAGCVIHIEGQQQATAANLAPGFSLDESTVVSGYAAKAGERRGSKEFKHYSIRVGQPAPITMGLVNGIWVDWDENLRVMEPDKQVELLCTAFPHNLMRAAFLNTGYLPASIATGKAISQPSAQPAADAAPVAAGQPRSGLAAAGSPLILDEGTVRGGDTVEKPAGQVSDAMPDPNISPETYASQGDGMAAPANPGQPTGDAAEAGSEMASMTKTLRVLKYGQQQTGSQVAPPQPNTPQQQ